MSENKNCALVALNCAYRFSREDIEDLILSENEETVTVRYEGGYELKVNVACDSVSAMIYDVAKAIIQEG